MSYYLLRVINKNRWRSPEEFPWLPPGHLPADPLADLRTNNNSLSLFQVSQDRSNLDRIVAALAANRDELSNLDYALFEERVLAELEIQSRGSPGETPDKEVNDKWHIDIMSLSAQRVVDLATSIFQRSSKERCLPKDVANLVVRAVSDKRFDLEQTRLNEQARRRVRAVLAL